MKPGLRKFTLTLHIVLSVGWLGAVIAYLAVAIAGLTSQDAQTVFAAYLSMEVIGWFVIVPFSLATLLTGLVEALGTNWGLFRHWWVLAKFSLTTSGSIILLQHMPTVTRMAQIARGMTLSVTDFRALRIQLVVHAAGGLLILLTATVLSVYKPWGMTPYGLREQRERRSASLLIPSLHPISEVTADLETTTKTPRWAYVVGFHAIGLALIFVILHLTNGGMWGH